MDKDNRHGGDIGSHVRQRVTSRLTLQKGVLKRFRLIHYNMGI